MKCEKIVGLDLGDKFSYACVLDANTGEVVREKRIATRASSLETFFAGQPTMLIATFTGTHSPWISRCAAPAPSPEKLAPSSLKRY